MKHSLINVMSLSLLTMVVACGKSSNNSGTSTDGSRQEMQVTEGHYRAPIRPINSYVSGWVPSGMADIRINGDEIQVSTWMHDAAAVPHMQNIHLGTKCPPLSADTNNDGFIDINELQRVVNKVFLPLDDDLEHQLEGQDKYPSGKLYNYFKKGSLSKMMEDLWGPDQDRSDNIVKLKRGQPLNLEGKVIIVHGSATNRVFPGSVASDGKNTVQATIPIGCGIIERMPSNLTVVTH